MARKIPQTVWYQIRHAFAAGVSCREIGRQLGISHNTILARSAKERWMETYRKVVLDRVGNAVARVKPDDPMYKDSSDIIADALKHSGDQAKIHVSVAVAKSARKAREAARTLTPKSYSDLETIERMRTSLWPEATRVDTRSVSAKFKLSVDKDGQFITSPETRELIRRSLEAM